MWHRHGMMWHHGLDLVERVGSWAVGELLFPQTGVLEGGGALKDGWARGSRILSTEIHQLSFHLHPRPSVLKPGHHLKRSKECLVIITRI